MIETGLAFGFLPQLTVRCSSHSRAVTFEHAVSGEPANRNAKSELRRQTPIWQRPSVVPHLTDAMTTSFPSGHALLSAIIYLSVGTVIATRTERTGVAVLAIAFPALLTVLVGFSRIYLGVHYPTDVLASWAAGCGWALLCGAVQMLYDRRTPSRTFLTE